MTQGYSKFVGYCDCFGNDLIPGGYDCGNLSNAISIGQQLILEW